MGETKGKRDTEICSGWGWGQGPGSREVDTVLPTLDPLGIPQRKEIVTHRDLRVSPDTGRSDWDPP